MDMKISAYRQSVRETPLKEGDIVNAVNVKHGKDGSYILTINGKNVEAVSKDLLFNPPLRLQIVKTSPLEVELLKQNSMQQLQIGDKVNVKLISTLNQGYMVEINGKPYNASFINTPQGSRIIAEVIKTDGMLLLKDTNISPKLSSLSLMAREISSFNQREIVQILKDYGALQLPSFLADDIKKFLRNSGQFFENKLSKGVSIDSDSKLAAYIQGNNTAENAITKLQIANVLMGSDFFAFFENEELDFDEGVMRFSRNNKGSYSLFIKMNFTKIGETIISFIKHYENTYNITVRTKVNISAELSRLNIKNCRIYWKEMQERDKEFFIIQKDNLKEMQGFETIG